MHRLTGWGVFLHNGLIQWFYLRAAGRLVAGIDDWFDDRWRSMHPTPTSFLLYSHPFPQPSFRRTPAPLTNTPTQITSYERHKARATARREAPVTSEQGQTPIWPGDEMGWTPPLTRVP